MKARFETLHVLDFYSVQSKERNPYLGDCSLQTTPKDIYSEISIMFQQEKDQNCLGIPRKVGEGLQSNVLIDKIWGITWNFFT